MVAQFNQTTTIAKAARQAAMHPNALRYWIRKGLIETVQTPYGRAVIQESLEEFLQRRAGEKSEALSR